MNDIQISKDDDDVDDDDDADDDDDVDDVDDVLKEAKKLVRANRSEKLTRRGNSLSIREYV